MPELPEVEHFRRLLLPLCSESEPLSLELLGKNHNKKFLTPEQAKAINKEKLVCRSIERRGKLICMVLRPPIAAKAPSREKKGKSNADDGRIRYLYVHMGMTGQITTPERVPCFGHVDSRMEAPEEYPPRFSYLRFTTTSAGSGPDDSENASACFSDPRKFGYVSCVEDVSELESLSPDALTEMESVPDNAWCDRSVAIKSVMLDQKKVVSGIGNWVADEVLWRAKIHPLQTYLTLEESRRVNDAVKYVMETAVSSSDTSSPYPANWLFHVRWGKGKNTDCKDAYGRSLKFIDAGGRTSAIAPSVQKLCKKDRGPTDKKKEKEEKGRKAARPRKSKPEKVKSEFPASKVEAASPATKRKAKSTAESKRGKRTKSETEQNKEVDPVECKPIVLRVVSDASATKSEGALIIATAAMKAIQNGKKGRRLGMRRSSRRK